MAKPQSTTDALARKNRREVAPPGLLTTGAYRVVRPAHIQSLEEASRKEPESLQQAIEMERGRLATAQSVLGCLHAALVTAEQAESPNAGYAEVTAIAIGLIRDVALRLDAVYLNPLIEDLAKPNSSGSRRRSMGLRR